MGSWQAKFFGVCVRLFLRRRRWGRDEWAVARRARRIFGAPKLVQWLTTLGLEVQPVNERGVRGEWLRKKRHSANAKDGIIFYIHGGGFVSCSVATHRPMTAALARRTGFPVFALDYRLAPEHRFPAALDDVQAGYQWLLEQGFVADKIAVAGDSAGGGLLMSLLLRLRDAALALPACAVCFSAWTDLTGSGESNRFNATRDAMFYPENVSEFAAAYLGGQSSANPDASSVFGNFRGLPPLLFQAGSTEILLDDSRRIHQKIQEIGGASDLEIYDDLFHGGQMMHRFIPEAETALKKAIDFIKRHTV